MIKAFSMCIIFTVAGCSLTGTSPPKVGGGLVPINNNNELVAINGGATTTRYSAPARVIVEPTIASQNANQKQRASLIKNNLPDKSPFKETAPPPPQIHPPVAIERTAPAAATMPSKESNGQPNTVVASQEATARYARNPDAIGYGWQGADRYIKNRDLDEIEKAILGITPTTNPQKFAQGRALCLNVAARHTYRETKTTGATEYFAAAAWRDAQAAASGTGIEPAIKSPPGARKGFQNERAELAALMASPASQCVVKELGCAEALLAGAEYEVSENYDKHAKRFFVDEFKKIMASAQEKGQACATPAMKEFTLRGDALFAFDKWELKDLTNDGQAIIQSMANAIKTQYSLDSISRINVVGHTDRLGSDEYNETLSGRRAKTIADYLGSLLGRQITSEGKGKRHPVTTGCNQKKRDELIQCYAPDRRVTVEIYGATAASKYVN